MIKDFPAIIVNADDFGLTRSVTEAILDIHHLGNLTSTTMMVNMPGTDHAAQELNQNPNLGVGLHFCLTEGSPISRAPSLQSNGEFFDRNTFIKRSLTGKIKSADITAEFEAQYNRFISFGRKPTHSDSHQHIHMLPQVFYAMRPRLRSWKLPVRIVSPPQLQTKLAFVRPLKFGKQFILSSIAGGLKRNSGVPTNEILVSMHELESLPTNHDIYQQMVISNPSYKSIEVMVHPYKRAEDINSMYKDKHLIMNSFLNKCYVEYDLMRQPNLWGDYASLLTTFASLK
jgi:chitin disaccharide deacetylase